MFLMAIGLNSIFGYVVGGFTEAGKYAGQTFFYGGLFILAFYFVKSIFLSHKKSKNLILKEK